MIRAWALSGLGLLFHARCRECGRGIHDPFLSVLCAGCWAGLSRLPAARCGRCALPGGVTEQCRDCLRLKPVFRRTAAAAVFEGRWRELCHQYKFEGKTSLVRPLSGRMAEALRQTGWEAPAGLVHVPVGEETFRRRGYDQTEGLARAVARRLGAACFPGVLRKAPGVRRQSELTRSQRFDNVRQAFKATLPAGLKGRPLLLVDDIMTTGATLNACARALLEEGASSVDVLVLARSL